MGTLIKLSLLPRILFRAAFLRQLLGRRISPVGAKNIVLLLTSTLFRMASRSISLRGQGRNFTVTSLRCACEPITPTSASWELNPMAMCRRFN